MFGFSFGVPKPQIEQKLQESSFYQNHDFLSLHTKIKVRSVVHQTNYGAPHIRFYPHSTNVGKCDRG